MVQLVRISEAASLALHAAVMLCQQRAKRFTNQQIASVLGASTHHLAKVTARLVKAGLLSSSPGPGGGFQLARAADEIKLVDIYEAVDGPISPGGCLLPERICSGADCLLGELVQSVHERIRSYFAKTSLAELAERAGFLNEVASGESAPSKPATNPPYHPATDQPVQQPLACLSDVQAAADTGGKSA